jgi:hypothetical protein
MTEENFLERLKEKFPNHTFSLEKNEDKLHIKIDDEIISLSWEKGLSEELERLYGINIDEDVFELTYAEVEAILESSNTSDP